MTEVLHKRGDCKGRRRFWAYEKQPDGSIKERWRTRSDYNRRVIQTRQLSAKWKRDQRRCNKKS